MAEPFIGIDYSPQLWAIVERLTNIQSALENHNNHFVEFKNDFKEFKNDFKEYKGAFNVYRGDFADFQGDFHVLKSRGSSITDGIVTRSVCDECEETAALTLMALVDAEMTDAYQIALAAIRQQQQQNP